MSNYQLAQLNIATMVYDLDSPEMADFVANLEPVNQLAEQSEGFVWRLQTEEGDATAIDTFGADVLVNMSVWQSVESLHTYVYRTAHTYIMARRNEWFERMTDAYSVLWWVPEGQMPTVEEAKERLEHMRENGPSEYAFTFKKAFPAPGSKTDDEPEQWDDLCPA